MTFLEISFARLERAGDANVLCEVRNGRSIPITGRQLLGMIEQARAFVAGRVIKERRTAARDPRTTAFAGAALDLALMAE